MKTYYFKFTGLPFVYTAIKAANKVIAQNVVKKYRDDGVCFEAKDIALSFDDLHNGRFKYSQLRHIQQMQNYKIKNSINGVDYILTLRKNKNLDDLIQHYAMFPSIQKANIVTIGGKSYFGLKNTPKLTDYIMTLLGVSETPKELQQKDAFIPICMFSPTKEKPQDVKLLKEEKEEKFIPFGDNDSSNVQ